MVGASTGQDDLEVYVLLNFSHRRNGTADDIVIVGRNHCTLNERGCAADARRCTNGFKDGPCREPLCQHCVADRTGITIDFELGAVHKTAANRAIDHGRACANRTCFASGNNLEGIVVDHQVVTGRSIRATRPINNPAANALRRAHKGIFISIFSYKSFTYQFYDVKKTNTHPC